MPTVNRPEIIDFIELSTDELANRYAHSVGQFDRHVLTLESDQVDLVFPSEDGVGCWPIRILLGHLADAELAFTHRIRRVATEDNPTFAIWDEHAFLDTQVYGHAHHP